MQKKPKLRILKPSIEVILATTTILGTLIGFIAGCLFDSFGGLLIKIYFIILFTLEGTLIGFACPIFTLFLAYGIIIILEYVRNCLQSNLGS